MIDIHHHLVYGVDDGARTAQVMQAMLRRAADQGVTDIVCTSHCTPGREAFPIRLYEARLLEGRSYCRENGIPVRLYPGAEIYYTDETPRLLAEGHAPTLCGKDVVLLEFGCRDSFERIVNAARQVGNEGFEVIFAHVERYDALRKLDNIRRLKEYYGVYMQMNGRTIYAKQGFFARRWTQKVLDEGLIDMIASDAHDVQERRCSLKHACEALGEIVGKSRAQRMCGGIQQMLLNF